MVLDQFFKYVLEHEAAEAMAQDDEVRKSLEEAGRWCGLITCSGRGISIDRKYSLKRFDK